MHIEYLWNTLARSLASQKGVVIPSCILSDLVESTGHSRLWIDFDNTFSLGLQEIVKVVLVTCVVVDNSQEIVQSKFGKGNRLVHGIQVLGVHGGNQLANQMESLGKGQSQSLIFQNLMGLVAEIIGFTAVWGNLQYL